MPRISGVFSMVLNGIWRKGTQAYVELAYMTGILPIAKYSGGSELNMFVEYDMATNQISSYWTGSGPYDEIFSYNSEIELSAVVNLVYLAVRDK